MVGKRCCITQIVLSVRVQVHEYEKYNRASKGLNAIKQAIMITGMNGLTNYRSLTQPQC